MKVLYKELQEQKIFLVIKLENQPEKFRLQCAEPEVTLQKGIRNMMQIQAVKFNEL